jgi:hypothetical protein
VRRGQSNEPAMLLLVEKELGSMHGHVGEYTSGPVYQERSP